MNAAAVEVKDLIVHMGGRCVLEVSDLRIEAGTVAALMGPNGAGKSTLLQACLGLTPPTRGEVLVLGRNVGLLRGGALLRLRRRIGYVPQLLPARSELPLTVREVVSIGRAGRVGLFRRLSPADWRVVDEWIERLGLAGLAHRAFSEISGGEQRKTVIARAMAQEPELLLLDEPTANLDLGWRERLVETIEQLHTQTGLGILLVCHEMEVLPPSCRQVILLEAGRVLASGVPRDVFTTERTRQLYGAGLRVVQCGNRLAVLPGGGGA